MMLYKDYVYEIEMTTKIKRGMKTKSLGYFKGDKAIEVLNDFGENPVCYYESTALDGSKHYLFSNAKGAGCSIIEIPRYKAIEWISDYERELRAGVENPIYGKEMCDGLREVFGERITDEEIEHRVKYRW